MAVPNLTQMIAHVRRKCQIPGTSGMSDADITAEINVKYFTWYAMKNPEIHASDGAGATSLPAGSRSINITNTDDEILVLVLQESNSGGAQRIGMDGLSWDTVLALQEDTGQAQPRFYGVRRTDTSLDFVVNFYPIPDKQYYVGRYTKPTVSALAGVGSPELQQEEAFWICDFASAGIAPLVGRSRDFAADILAGIPSYARRIMDGQEKVRLGFKDIIQRQA